MNEGMSIVLHRHEITSEDVYYPCLTNKEQDLYHIYNTTSFLGVHGYGVKGHGKLMFGRKRRRKYIGDANRYYVLLVKYTILLVAQSILTYGSFVEDILHIF